MCKLIGGILDNKYQVLESIGEGGFASVHKGRVLENDDTIAIKFYYGFQDEVDMPRFRREVKMMSLIDHENVIKIFDYNLEACPPYIVMPLAKCSLDKCTESLKSDEEKTLGIFLKACEGIKELHKNGIYHRDIKSSNILLSQSGEILIADLGLARLESIEPITQDYDWTGTEMYTPPEWYSREGYKNADERGDVFQLGKTLYNLLTGKKPGLLELELLSPGLQIIITKAIEDKPSNRYQSVDELIKNIKYYLEILKPSSHPEDLFDFYLDELSKLPSNETYDSEPVKGMLTSLYLCKGDDEIFLDLFDKIPINLLESPAKEADVTFQMIIKEYSLIMIKLSENFDRDFAYAEIVAKRMKTLYNYTSDIQNKITALRIILKISVAACRYTAMNTFSDILKSITDSGEGIAISLMLKDEIEDYSKLLLWTRVSVQVTDLHYTLREITRSAREITRSTQNFNNG